LTEQLYHEKTLKATKICTDPKKLCSVTIDVRQNIKKEE